MSEEYKKKSAEELDDYMTKFRRRGYTIRKKKGKGSEYSRMEQKKKNKIAENE